VIYQIRRSPIFLRGVEDIERGRYGFGGGATALLWLLCPDPCRRGRKERSSEKT